VQLLQRLDCLLRAVSHRGGELCTAPALPTCLHHVLPARDGLNPALIDAKLDEVFQARAKPERRLTEGEANPRRAGSVVQLW
jgi:hypothetical protein